MSEDKAKSSLLFLKEQNKNLKNAFLMRLTCLLRGTYSGKISMPIELRFIF